MSEWADKWNALPFEIRCIGAMTDIELRINQLLVERARTEKHYRAHIKEIDAHIKHLRQELEREGGIR